MQHWGIEDTDEFDRWKWFTNLNCHSLHWLWACIVMLADMYFMYMAAQRNGSHPKILEFFKGHYSVVKKCLFHCRNCLISSNVCIIPWGIKWSPGAQLPTKALNVRWSGRFLLGNHSTYILWTVTLFSCAASYMKYISASSALMLPHILLEIRAENEWFKPGKCLYALNLTVPSITSMLHLPPIHIPIWNLLTKVPSTHLYISGT